MDRYCVIIIDARKLRRAVRWQRVEITWLRYGSAADVLCFRVHEKDIQPAQTMNQSRFASVCFTIVECKTTFTHPSQRMFCYGRAFEKHYGVCFVEVCILGMLDNLLSWNSLPSNSRRTHIRYSRVGERMIKCKEVLRLFRKLGKDVPELNTVSFTYLDDQRLYILSAREIYVVIQALDEIFKNDDRPGPSMDISSTDTLLDSVMNIMFVTWNNLKSNFGRIQCCSKILFNN